MINLRRLKIPVGSQVLRGIPFKSSALHYSRVPAVDGEMLDKTATVARPSAPPRVWDGDGSAKLRFADFPSETVTYYDNVLGSEQTGSTDVNGDFTLPTNQVTYIKISTYIWNPSEITDSSSNNQGEFYDESGTYKAQVFNSYHTDQTDSWAEQDARGLAVCDEYGYTVAGASDVIFKNEASMIEYNIDNILDGDGDFEVDGGSGTGENWSSAGTTPSLDASIKNTGAKSQKQVVTGGWNMQYVQTMIAGHEYYTYGYAYVQGSADNAITFRVDGLGQNNFSTSLIEQWQYRGFKYTATGTSHNIVLQNGSAPGAATYNFDTFGTIDLTNIFGSGNEPAVEWLDGVLSQAINAYGYIDEISLYLALSGIPYEPNQYIQALRNADGSYSTQYAKGWVSDGAGGSEHVALEYVGRVKHTLYKTDVAGTVVTTGDITTSDYCKMMDSEGKIWPLIYQSDVDNDTFYDDTDPQVPTVKNNAVTVFSTSPNIADQTFSKFDGTTLKELAHYEEPQMGDALARIKAYFGIA